MLRNTSPLPCLSVPVLPSPMGPEADVAPSLSLHHKSQLKSLNNPEAAPMPLCASSRCEGPGDCGEPRNGAERGPSPRGLLMAPGSSAPHGDCGTGVRGFDTSVGHSAKEPLLGAGTLLRLGGCTSSSGARAGDCCWGPHFFSYTDELAT